MVLIDAVAGCEEHNLDFFLKLGGAVTAETPEELAELALSLLSDEARLKKCSPRSRRRTSFPPKKSMRTCSAARINRSFKENA